MKRSSGWQRDFLRRYLANCRPTIAEAYRTATQEYQGGPPTYSAACKFVRQLEAGVRRVPVHGRVYVCGLAFQHPVLREPRAGVLTVSLVRGQSGVRVCTADGELVCVATRDIKADQGSVEARG